MTQDILIDRDEGLMTLTLNRPEKMNPLSGEMITSALDAVLDVMQNRSARAILITGAGRGFCAGADLAGSKLSERRDGIEGYMQAGINRLIQTIREVPVPVVAALNGPAAGAGAGLAMAADIVIAARSASLLTAFARIGAVLDAGMSWALTHKAGPARATGLAMLADQPISAETARDWGLIWDVVDDDELMPQARALAHRLANGPTVTLGLIKRQIATAQTSSLADALRLEAASQGQAFKTEDFLEGVTAFQNKRPAEFKGR